MQTASAAPTTKGATIASSRTHVWGRDSSDPRLWLVIPADLQAPTFHAVTDDFGTLVPVGGAR